jgi:hypothetical protein
MMPFHLPSFILGVAHTIAFIVGMNAIGWLK